MNSIFTIVALQKGFLEERKKPELLKSFSKIPAWVDPTGLQKMNYLIDYQQVYNLVELLVELLSFFSFYLA